MDPSHFDWEDLHKFVADYAFISLDMVTEVLSRNPSAHLRKDSTIISLRGVTRDFSLISSTVLKIEPWEDSSS